MATCPGAAEASASVPAAVSTINAPRPSDGHSSRAIRPRRSIRVS